MRWKPGDRALFRGQVVEILSVQREDYLSDEYFTLFFVDPSTDRAGWHLEAYVSPLPKEPVCDE